MTPARPPFPLPVTRFAPSPTGRLHLGHAFSALDAWTQAQGGRFLLRIEDIDATRCRREYEDALIEDLAWLGSGLEGFGWEHPVRRQSEHMADYRRALDALSARGLLYPCFCTRRDIALEAARSASAPHRSPHPAPGLAPLYPGTCRRLDEKERAARRDSGAAYALRLNMARALGEAGPLVWEDALRGPQEARPELHGDVVLARKETPASYHLAVTLDDHLQGVTLVTRGEDLFESTHIHRLLQALLGLATPRYRHHRLLTDASGVRLAKRDHAPTLCALREQGLSAAAVRAMAGFDDSTRVMRGPGNAF